MQRSQVDGNSIADEKNDYESKSARNLIIWEIYQWSQKVEVKGVKEKGEDK